MTKRNLLAVLLSAAALMAAPVIGCGDTDDPSGNDNQNQNNNDEDDCEDDTDCDDGEECDTDEGVCVDADPNGNGEGCEDDTDCDGLQVCDEDENECVDPEFEFDCQANEDFYGQIGEDEDVDHSGGEPTTDALETDAGLSEVVDAIEGEIDGTIDGEEDEVDLDFSNEPIEIEGATVVAVEFIGFWVQDSETALYVFNSNNNENIDISNPDVGQQVNFEVTEAGTFFADTQITGLDEWEVVEDNTPVPYHEIEDEPIELDDHYHQVIRVGGQLGTGENDIYECGEEFGQPQICFNMYYGDDGEHSVTFRTSEDNSIWEQDDCLTYVGPVQSFPGFYSDNPEPQLQEAEFDWTGFPGFAD